MVIAQSGMQDIKDAKKYILNNFKYRELGVNFTRKMKKAALELNTFPAGYDKTGFQYREVDIYLKPYHAYLLFYTIDEVSRTVTVLRVMQDGMNWMY